MKSIKSKLIASTFILLIALVAIALVYFPSQHRQQALLAFEGELQVLCETLGLTIALGFEEDNFESMQAAFNFVKSDVALNYIAVFDADKDLIAVYPDTISESSIAIPDGLIERPDHVIYGSPITNGENHHGYVTISKSLNELNERIAQSQFHTLLLGLIVLIPSLIAFYLMAKLVADPLNQLTNATQEVANGDYDVRVMIKNQDETGTLATNFNQMTEALERNTAELHQAREEAEIGIFGQYEP